MSAKRHHYVPQFYLRYFLLNGAKTLWVYDKEGGEPKPQQPKDTAVIGRFYSEKLENGNQFDVEAELSKVEGIAAPILDHWQKDKAIPSESEIGEIAYFLALLHVRVPRTVAVAQEAGLATILALFENLKENPEQARKSWEKFVEETGETVLSWEDFVEFITNPLDKFEIEMNKKVALGFSMLCTHEIAHALRCMNWCLCKAPEPLFFFTSDAPVTSFRKTSDGAHAQLGAGFLLDNLEVTFPISPKVCLLLDRKHGQKHRRIKEALVKEINRRTAHMAERYIFSPMDTKLTRRMVVESSKTRQMPKLDREVLMRRVRAQQRRFKYLAPQEE